MSDEPSRRERPAGAIAGERSSASAEGGPSSGCGRDGAPPPRRRLRTFDSLIDVPAFRWYLFSMIGNWSALQMQQVVRGYLAYQITGSFAALGGVALANSVPRLALALTGGVIADRANRRHVMQLGQAFNALLAAAVAVLLFTDLLRFEHLVIGAVLQGISNSFTQPARQAMIPQIVGAERLTNAIGLNTSAMNSMRLLAPALAGVLLAVVGASWVYVLMAALYGFAVIAMLRVPTERGEPSAVASSAAGAALAPEHGRGTAARRSSRGGGRGGLRDIVAAFAYLRQQPVLMMLLVVHLFIVLFSMPYQRLLPGFVDDLLSSSPDQTAIRMGLLLTFTGLGALIGSLVVASLPNRHRGRLLIASIVVLGLALLAFSASSMFWLSIGIVIVLGVGQAGRQSLSNILIQTHVDNEFRGRISSIMMMEMGLESLGTFGISVLAEVIGVQWALGGVAVGLLCVALVIMLFVPSYRRLD